MAKGKSYAGWTPAPRARPLPSAFSLLPFAFCLLLIPLNACQSSYWENRGGVWRSSLASDTTSSAPSNSQNPAQNDDGAAGGSPSDERPTDMDANDDEPVTIAAASLPEAPNPPPASSTTSTSASNPMVEPVKAARGPADAGAQVVVDAMSAMLDELDLPPGEPSIVSVDEVSNLSHATAREFESMCGRLADLLDDAGRNRRLLFTTDPPSRPQFHLLGTAYLVTSDGLDQWELFLSLRPAGKDWSVWRSSGPVRLLRLPRPNSQQIFYPIRLK